MSYNQEAPVLQWAWSPYQFIYDILQSEKSWDPFHAID